MNKLQRTLRYYKLRFLRLKGEPRHIAKGVALGTFIGITPTMPFHTVAILLIAPLIRANLIGAFIAGWAVCNPLTYFLQYYLSWRIGTAITPYNLSWERIHQLMAVIFSGAGLKVTLTALSSLGGEAIVVMCLGGVVLATPFTVLAYVLTFRFFTRRRQKRGANRSQMPAGGESD